MFDLRMDSMKRQQEELIGQLRAAIDAAMPSNQSTYEMSMAKWERDVAEFEVAEASRASRPTTNGEAPPTFATAGNDGNDNANGAPEDEPKKRACFLSLWFSVAFRFCLTRKT